MPQDHTFEELSSYLASYCWPAALAFLQQFGVYLGVIFGVFVTLLVISLLTRGAKA